VKKPTIGINIHPNINKIYPDIIIIGCGRFLIPLNCKVYFIMVLNVINEYASVNANQFLKFCKYVFMEELYNEYGHPLIGIE